MNTKEIPEQDGSYTYGWGIRPEGGESGYWMYVKGLDFYDKPFEHWSFMENRDFKTYLENPEAFFKRWAGIKEVAKVHPDLAWRYQKNRIRLFI